MDLNTVRMDLMKMFHIVPFEDAKKVFSNVQIINVFWRIDNAMVWMNVVIIATRKVVRVPNLICLGVLKDLVFLKTKDVIRDLTVLMPVTKLVSILVFY